MLIMTAKMDKRKLILALATVIVAIVLLLSLFTGGDQPAGTNATAILGDTNDARVKFLTDQGWEVTTTPKETMEVRIPRETDDVFTRYNELQKSQGFDLSQYAGKKVMRYVYQINNYPNAVQPVYATILVYKNQIIGGDITDTSPGGRVQGFQKQ